MLWKKFEIAAVLDGYSRKLLAMRLFARRPTARDMNLLIKEAIRREGQSARFLISDRGSQFRRRFSKACVSEDIWHISSKVRCWQINAKIERFFRTMKLWARMARMVPTQPRMQKRLEQYRAWYNQHRVHGAHHAHTPQEKMQGHEPVPILYTAKGRDRAADLCDMTIFTRGSEALLAGYQSQGVEEGRLKQQPKTNRRSTIKYWPATVTEFVATY